MNNHRGDDEAKDCFLRSICDKRAFDAIDMLKIVNKSKCDLVKSKVLSYFERTKKPISFDLYCELISNIDKDICVSVHRKNNLYDLDDIEE